MSREDDQGLIPDEVILAKIYLIRGMKVMLDKDLAELYGVETKQLKRAVRRNHRRFPDDFMFELSSGEFEDLRSQIGTSRWGGVRYPPMAFTEQGVSMISSVLNNERAIQVNIKIIRLFTRMRKMLLQYRDILEKLHEIEDRITGQDEKILLIFDYLKQLELEKQRENEQSERKRIGFRPGRE